MSGEFEDLEDTIETLRSAEERLRDAAYERLRAAADGDDEAVWAERRIQSARRAVARAIQALGAEPDLPTAD
jgi:hypothetical protein